MTHTLRQAGFTVFELIVIIGILMATSLRYYQDLIDDARAAGVKYLAARFSLAVSNVHLKWLLQDVADTTLSQPIASVTFLITGRNPAG